MITPEQARGSELSPSPATATRRRQLLTVAGITLFGALLRFATLDIQSFWNDEAYTVLLTQKGLGDMLSQIYNADLNPPLYYTLAAGWTRIFGDGEVGLRSLSALFGTALIPVSYAIASRLGGFRVGCVAAALVATSPILIWYSQEGRSYALVALLGGVSLFCFLRSLEAQDRGWLAAWAVSSGLALLAHYVAVFLIGPEMVWLLVVAGVRRRKRLRTSVAVGAVVMVGAALVPLALHQHGLGGGGWFGGAGDRTRSGIGWIASGEAGGLPRRAVGTVPAELLTGLNLPYHSLLAALAAGLSLIAVALLLSRGDQDARRAARVPLALAVLVPLVPLILALAGEDFLVSRNVITALLPLLLVVALGAGARRAGRAGIAVWVALCALGVGSVALVNSDARYQRDDWRSAAQTLLSLPANGPRAILVTPSDGEHPLSVYLPGFHELGHTPEPVSEIDLLSLAERAPGKPLQTPRPPTPPPPARRFTFVSRVQGETFTLVRYRASSRAPVSAPMLAAHTLTGEQGFALLSPGGGRPR